MKLGRNRLGEITEGRQKSVQLDYLRLLTSLARHLCKGHSQGSTIKHDNPAFIAGGVLLVIKIKMSLTHNRPRGEDFLGLSKSVQLVTQDARSGLSQARRPTAGFRDHILLQVGLAQQLLLSSTELPQPSACCGQLERLDNSCANTHSGAFQLKALWQRQLTRYAKPSSPGHWVGEVTDRFTDPGPVLLISAEPQKETCTFLSFLHHPH